MKLTGLSLDFKSFTHQTIPLGAPRVLIVGRNGAGKTSIRESIRWAIRGVAQGTDAKGAGAEVLIPPGSNAARVELGIEGLGTVKRAYANDVGGGFGVEGFTGNAGSQLQALYARLGASEAILDAVLETDTFLRLSHADAKALVLALLNVRIEIPGHAKPYTLWELDEMYGQAFEERKIAKRKLKDLPSLPMPAEPEGGVYEEGSIEAQLTKLRDQATELSRRVGEATAQRAALEKSLADKRNALKNNKDFIAGQTIEDLRARYAALEHEINDALATTDAVPVQQQEEPDEDSPKRLAFLRNRLEALEAHKPTGGCVLDPDVRCDTPRQQFTKRAKAVKAEIEELSATGDRLTLATETAAPAKDGGRLLELQNLQRTITEYQEIEAEIPTLEAMIADFEAQLAALPTAPEDEEALSKLKNRIAIGENMLKANRTYHAELKKATDAKKAITDQETRVATLEEAVQTLGPNGIRVQALQAQLARFVDGINGFLSPFGMTVVFELDPWAVLVNGRPVDTYSRSEQYRIGIAIQLAVAHLSGVGFAIIDELDMLDLDGRGIVGRLLHEAPLQQIVILKTQDDIDKATNAPTPLPKLPGWLVHRLVRDTDGSHIVESIQG